MLRVNRQRRSSGLYKNPVPTLSARHSLFSILSQLRAYRRGLRRRRHPVPRPS